MRIVLSELLGKKKRTIYAAGEAGINRALWDLRFDPGPEQTARFVRRIEKTIARISKLPQMSTEQRRPLNKARSDLQKAKTDYELNRIFDDLQENFGYMSIFRSAFRGRLRGQPVPPGEYEVTLAVGGKEYKGSITVRRDPMLDDED